MKVVVKKNTSVLTLSKGGPVFSFACLKEDGSTVLRSDLYKSKDSAMKGIRAVKKSCTNEKRYLIKKSTNGMFFFNIKSANGLIIVCSAMFNSEQEMQDAMDLVKDSMPDCDTEFQLIG